MREIVLDTETTGFRPAEGHRIVEIGCVELLNHVPTGTTFQRYINPERDMPEGARQVHGLSADFLAGYPVFAEIVEDFQAFIGDDPLVIHNAEFDMSFLNAELKLLGMPPLPLRRAIDTVQLARKKFPGAQASLDALCRRFAIDSSARTKHGALLDAELLAEVYLELVGGRQPGFGLDRRDEAAIAGALTAANRPVRPPRPHAPGENELAAHQALVDRLKNPIWKA